MNMADDRLVAEVADLLREKDERQLMAVLIFAVHLKTAALQGAFNHA